MTYAQVAAHPFKHRERTNSRRTLVILDEIHHGGDAKSWGDGIREAFEDAERRLSLTGTPFRSDDSPIPFVTYEPDGQGHQRSKADHAYGYADALADGVVRPVVFLAYSGEARWRSMPARSSPPVSESRSAPTRCPGLARRADLTATDAAAAGGTPACVRSGPAVSPTPAAW